MARQNINTGAAANDRTGDPLRTAFTKVNANFTELYANVATISSNISEPVDYADILNAPTDISDLTDTTDLLSPPPPTSLVNGDNEVTLDSLGTLSVPYQSTNNAFQLTLSASNYVSTTQKPTLPLVGAPWVFNASFSYESDGQFVLNVTNVTLPSATNPGYSTGDVFTFNSTVHNIEGYILSVTLDDVLQNTTWTADLIISSPAPVYPSTIDSLGIIKLTAANNDLILGTDGSLTLPSGSPILFGNGNARIQSGMGFHINSEEGISIEAVNADNPLSPITKSWFFGVDGILSLPTDSPILFGNGNARIQSDDGFHVSSEDGVLIEAVDATDTLNPITKSWSFDTNGILQLPSGGDIVDSSGTSVLGGGTVLANTYTRVTTPVKSPNQTSVVIWTALYDTVSSVKLTIQLETNQVGDATGWHSQVCEAIVASRGYANGQPGYGEPIMTVYGVTYTSTVPLVTFTVQRNATTSLIEIVGTRTAATNSAIDFRIHSVEMISRD